MKSSKYRVMLHMLVCIVISFVFIYIMVFIGGWKLIESGDPILIEIAVSIIVGIVVTLIYEHSIYCEAKFAEAEKRIEELEKQINELQKQ